MAPSFTIPILDLLVSATAKRVKRDPSAIENVHCPFLRKEKEKQSKLSFAPAKTQPPPQKEVPIQDPTPMDTTEDPVPSKGPEPTKQADVRIPHVTANVTSDPSDSIPASDVVEDIDPSSQELSPPRVLGEKNTKSVQQESKKGSPSKSSAEEEVEEIYSGYSSEEDTPKSSRDPPPVDTIVKDVTIKANPTPPQNDIPTVSDKTSSEPPKVQVPAPVVSIPAAPDHSTEMESDIHLSTVEMDIPEDEVAMEEDSDNSKSSEAFVVVEQQDDTDVYTVGTTRSGRQVRRPAAPKYLATLAADLMKEQSEESSSVLKLLYQWGNDTAMDDDCVSDTEDHNETTGAVGIDNRRKLSQAEICARERRKRFEAWLVVKVLGIGCVEDQNTILKLAEEKMSQVDVAKCEPGETAEMDETHQEAFDYAYVEKLLAFTRESLLKFAEGTRLGDVLRKMIAYPDMTFQTTTKKNADNMCYISNVNLQQVSKCTLKAGNATFVISRQWKTLLEFLQIVFHTDTFLLTCFADVINKTNGFDPNRPDLFGQVFFTFADGKYADLASFVVLEATKVGHIVCTDGRKFSM